MTTTFYTGGQEGRKMNRNLVLKKNRVLRLAVCTLLSLALILGLTPTPFGGTPTAYASGVSGMSIIRISNDPNGTDEFNEEQLQSDQSNTKYGWQWNAASNTLTLKDDFTFEKIWFNGTGDVNIFIEGHAYGGSIESESSGTLTISGFVGSQPGLKSILQLSSTTGNALFAEGNLIIDHLTIGAQTAADFAAVETNGDFIMNSGVLNLTGAGANSSGLRASGDISIGGTAKVQTNSGLSLNNGAIYASGNISIGGNSEVTVECGIGSALRSEETITISDNAVVEAVAGLQLPGTNAIQGDVTVLGGEVNIYDELVGNLIVQGGVVHGGFDVSGNVTVSGGGAAIKDIAGNLTVSGCDYAVGAQSVAGDLIVSGGNVTVSGDIGGDIAVTGGTVTIDGEQLLDYDASLISIAGQPVTATGTGTRNSPKTASISVPNSKTSIAASEIVAATGATNKLSSTNAFSDNMPAISLSVGGNNHLYITVVAQNGTSKLYYDVTVTRQAAPFVAVTGISGVPAVATVGQNLTLTGTVAPTNATNQAIAWSVKNAGATGATISGNAFKATAAGTAIITATVVNGLTETSDYTQDFTITVSPSDGNGNGNGNGDGNGNGNGNGNDNGDGDGTAKPTQTETAKSPAEISAVNVPTAPNATAGLPKTVDFGNGYKDDVTWTIDGKDQKIATIGKNGDLVGVSEGTVTLTATSKADPTKKITIKVTIAKNVTAIRSPIKTLYVQKGKAITPPVDFDGKDEKGKAWGYKGYGAFPKLTWTSNKTSVATVNPATGKITPKKVGTAKITATAMNGKAKIQFTVKVVKKALKLKKVSLTKPPKTLAKGKTAVLKVKLTPAKATGVKITFKSSKPSVVSVDKAGKLYGVAKGKAKITVKAGGKQKVVTIRVK
jgi:uncharacterized protein YjdB